MKLNKNICNEHLKALQTANEQWFYGHHVSELDMQHLESALTYFEYIRDELKKKLPEQWEKESVQTLKELMQ